MAASSPRLRLSQLLAHLISHVCALLFARVCGGVEHAYPTRTGEGGTSSGVTSGGIGQGGQQPVETGRTDVGGGRTEVGRTGGVGETTTGTSVTGGRTTGEETERGRGVRGHRKHFAGRRTADVQLS